MSAAKYAIVDSDLLVQDKICSFAKPSASLGLLGNIEEPAYIGLFVAPQKGPQSDWCHAWKGKEDVFGTYSQASWCD